MDTADITCRCLVRETVRRLLSAELNLAKVSCQQETC